MLPWSLSAMRRAKTVLWLLTVAALLAMIGCTLLTPLDGLSGGVRPDGGSPDASMDAPDDGSDSGADAGPDAECGADYIAAVLADETAVFYPLDDHGPVAKDRSGHNL